MLFTEAEAQISTTFKTAVVPVQFPDLSYPANDAVSNRLDSVFNQQNYSAYGATGSAHDYFYENLGNQYNLTFRVMQPVMLPYNYSYYAGSGVGNSSGTTLIQHTITAMQNAGYDLSSFDGNGDGYIDCIYIVFAGYGESENGAPDSIWPHSWNISSKKIKMGDLKVGIYCCSPYFSGSEGSRLTSIGIICHEMGHALGLKDMYDLNGSTEGTSEALWGTLSLMDKGNYNNEGKTPPYLNSVEREMLGIAKIQDISTPGNYYLKPIDESGMAFRIATSDPDEYFLLEYRSARGWDKFIGGNGLIVYHVDKSPDQAGSMTATERWMVNAVNCCADHQCVDVIEAMNDPSLGVAGVFFPGAGGVKDLLSTSKVPLLSWNRQGPMLCLRDISIVAGSMVFTLAEDHLWLEPNITSLKATTYQTDAKLSWTCEKEMPGQWKVAWKGSQDDIWQSTSYFSGNSYEFSSLTPGTNYVCVLSYAYSGIDLLDKNISFTTNQITSKYPMIAGLSSEKTVGDTLVLRVFNINEKVKSITWEINGAQYFQETYPLTYPGIVSLAATLKYNDNSTERIARTITVKSHNKEAAK